jgi:hypothetical protein
VLQDSIASRPCDQMHACIKEESNSYGITILPVEANQSDPLRVHAKSLR